MSEKIPAIKPPKAPTMTHYKVAAAVSRGVKLKAMAGGGNVPVQFVSPHVPISSISPHVPVPSVSPVVVPNVPAGRQPTSPIWKSVPPSLPSGGSRQAVSPPISKATAPFVGVSSMARGGKVIRGPAAEREMARMEKEAKATHNQRRPKKG
jgi:hypothetical protein